MQIGEYILDRILPKAVKKACDELGVAFEAFSDDWVLKMSRGEDTAWAYGYKFDLNRAAASTIAQDKVATYQVLAAAGVPAVLHCLARSIPGKALPEAHIAAALPPGDVVLKPLNGTSGRGIERFSQLTLALREIERRPEPGWAIAPYLDIAVETRVVILDDHIILSYEKRQPTEHGGIKFFNLSYGALAVDIDIEKTHNSIADLALRAAKALTLRLCAVDIVTLASGEHTVLEINDGFSMEHYAKQGSEYTARTEQLYHKIIEARFS